MEIVRSTVCSAFSDHRLSPLSRDVTLDAHFRGVRFTGSGIYYLEYGTEVLIEPLETGDFYLVQAALTGHACVTVDSRSFVSTPERASLVVPSRKASLTFDSASRHLVLRLDQASVERALRNKLGREPKAPLVFDPQMDFSTPGNRTFRGMLALLVDALDSTTAASSIAMQEFEGLLVSQLLLSQPSNYYDEIHDNRRPEPSVARPIARAAELIEAHAHEPLTIDDIAYAVGISARALQDGFRRSYETTPTAFLRDVRLQKVRTELMQADSTKTTVTDVALRWGLLHMGRFSVMYRNKFGETPLQTLRLKTDPSLRTKSKK